MNKPKLMIVYTDGPPSVEQLATSMEEIRQGHADGVVYTIDPSPVHTPLTEEERASISKSSEGFMAYIKDRLSQPSDGPVHFDPIPLAPGLLNGLLFGGGTEYSSAFREAMEEMPHRRYQSVGCRECGQTDCNGECMGDGLMGG